MALIAIAKPFLRHLEGHFKAIYDRHREVVDPRDRVGSPAAPGRGGYVGASTLSLPPAALASTRRAQAASWRRVTSPRSPRASSRRAPHSQVTPQVARGGMSVDFYDSARWQTLQGLGAAALYRDGRFAAPTDAPQTLKLKRHRWITIDDDYRDCSIIDWEQGNPCFTAQGLVRFVLGRRGLDKEAIPYFDRADAHAAVDALKSYGTGQLWRYPRLYFWLGTLDGTPLTAEDLAEQLADRWDAPIPTDRIWADQYLDDGTKDTSRLFLRW